MEGDDLPLGFLGGYFLELAREKLVSAIERDAAATMPLELRSELEKMTSIMMGSLERVDRGLLQTACHEICDTVDELQDNKGPPISGTTNHGPGVPMITIANKMKNMRDILENIDWQLYECATQEYSPGSGCYQGHAVYSLNNEGNEPPSDNKGGVPRYKPDQPPSGSIWTGRILEDTDKIITMLLVERAWNMTQQGYCPVIFPIVGVGGSGKTTLAKLVFCHNRLKAFRKGWVDNPTGKLVMINNVRGGKKPPLVVVLDDLQDKAGGSRLLDVISAVGRNGIVIVTTRSEAVAWKISEMEPYKLPPPLVRMQRTLKCLKESYERMPPNLKLCFAYCAIFPDGHSILKDDIIHQWIALDLIEQSDSSFSARQQLGEEYFGMLLGISFFQPAATKSTLTSEKEYKSATSFTMHKSVHALARSISRDEVIALDGRNGKPSEKKNYKYALLTNFDITPMKLSNILVKDVKALLLQGCSKFAKDSFSFAKGLRVLHIRDPSMKKLPGSICRLTQLRHLNLSGCSGLVELPESFRMLEELEHLYLSGCSGLVELPESFRKLEKLEYLDLSFCSCLEGIQSDLDGLTNLQHLNLSHPCCNLVEHGFYLECLKDVWDKLKRLRYLNLSMCLDPILRYMTEEERINKYIGSISRLSSLEHLDLSHNIFLSDLPESLGDLSHLHTLDLSGCTRLKRVHKRISEINSLKVLVIRNCRFLEKYELEVRADDVTDSSSNLVQLEYVESCKELEISYLEKVKSVEEAKRIRLHEKQKLEKLTLAWTEGSHGSSVHDKALLEALVPPQNLQRFGLHGYREECLPAWLTLSICSHLPNLVEVTMEDIPRCSALPPLFLLPNLKKVVLRRMASITRIDAGELSCTNREARLLQFILDDLEELEEFNTICCSGDTEFMFPIIDELEIHSCPKVKFRPFPPEAKRLQISACDQVMSLFSQACIMQQGCNNELGYVQCLVQRPKILFYYIFKKMMFLLLPKGGEGQGVDASSTSTTSARVNQLVVENCKLTLSGRSLLQHLPGLQSLCFSRCEGMTALPDCLGDLTYLQELDIHGCQGIKSLPQSIYRLINLKNLRIRGCPELKRWCELEENKKKLAHIQAIYEESGTEEPDTTANLTANRQLTLSQMLEETD